MNIKNASRFNTVFKLPKLYKCNPLINRELNFFKIVYLTIYIYIKN